MATQAVAVRRLSGERRFFLGMAGALAICTFAGFAQSYYLMQFTGARGLSWMVHLHGALFTAWVLLFGTQAGLISARRPDIHMLTGAAAMVLAAAMIGLGVAVAVTSSQPPRFLLMTREQFLIFPLVSIGLFALFVVLGFANRHRPDFHKRFMLLATVNVILPALARMTVLLPFLPRGVLGGMVIANLFLAAFAAYDWRSRGKLHPVTVWGGGVTLAFEPLRFFIAHSEWWPEIASSLLV